MSDYDEYGDDWGYNGDAEHDMWVDYTTDMYEGSDYSGENPDGDIDWDAEYEANVDYHDGEVQQSVHSSSRPKGHTVAQETVQHYEHRIHQLEGLIAAAIASAAIFDKKSANAASAKNVRKYQIRASEKQSEAKRYQTELDKLKRNYATVKLESETARTRDIAVICAIVSFLAILIAIFY